MSKTRNEDWRTIEFCPELRGCSVNCDNVAALLADNLFAGNLKVRELFRSGIGRCGKTTLTSRTMTRNGI